MFLEDIRADTEGSINKMLAAIDAERSECFKQDDRDRIFHVVKTEVGFAGVNSMVFERMRDWVIDATREVMEEAAGDALEQLYLKRALAELYRQQGAYQQAEQLHLEVLERFKEQLGANHPDTLSSMRFLGNV